MKLNTTLRKALLHRYKKNIRKTSKIQLYLPCPTIHLSIHSSIHLLIYPTHSLIYPFTYPPIYQSISVHPLPYLILIHSFIFCIYPLSNYPFSYQFSIHLFTLLYAHSYLDVFELLGHSCVCIIACFIKIPQIIFFFYINFLFNRQI